MFEGLGCGKYYQYGYMRDWVARAYIIVYMAYFE